MNDTNESVNLNELAPDLRVAWHLQNALQLMREWKSEVKPGYARAWAIGITDLEHVIAWWDYHIVRTDEEPLPEKVER